ncbi:MAG: hypothetical protein V3V41_07440 [Candidatus Heimdallarchaeota archaeon]
MSERIEKDLDKVRREIENLESEMVSFKESLENILDLQKYYQILATLIQNKFITLNENLRGLIEKNKISLDELIAANVTEDKNLVSEWTTSQTDSVGGKLETTKEDLSVLQQSLVGLLSESKEKFDSFSSSFSENVNSILKSQELDLERLANAQVNTFRKSITDVKENIGEIKENSISTFEKNTEDLKTELEENIQITENIMLESIEHLRSEYGDKLTENMETIFESFNRIKSELGQLVDNVVQRIQVELSGVSDTMDKYLVDEIAKIQVVLADYEKGMIDVNAVAMSNFNTSKESMIQSYEDLSKQQLMNHSTELQEFEKGFHSQVDGVLDSFSEQSDSMKSEAKTVVSAEQDKMNKNFDELKTSLDEQVSLLQNETNNKINNRISSLEEEITEMKASIEKTSQQITTRLDSAQKDTVAEVSTFASTAKSQIASTQETTISDLETEVKDHIKQAEQAEKLKKDLINRLGRLEKNIEVIKNELYG